MYDTRRSERMLGWLLTLSDGALCAVVATAFWLFSATNKMLVRGTLLAVQQAPFLATPQQYGLQYLLMIPVLVLVHCAAFRVGLPPRRRLIAIAKQIGLMVGGEVGIGGCGHREERLRCHRRCGCDVVGPAHQRPLGTGDTGDGKRTVAQRGIRSCGHGPHASLGHQRRHRAQRIELRVRRVVGLGRTEGDHQRRGAGGGGGQMRRGRCRQPRGRHREPGCGCQQHQPAAQGTTPRHSDL